MRIRYRNWSFVLLVSVVLVGITQPISASDTDDSALTPEEQCAIFPEDQGFSPVPLAAANACLVQRGDCHSSETTGDCFQARITALASAEAARRQDSTFWTPVEGLGEAAFENQNDAGRPAYYLEFRRDRYHVWVLCDPVLTEEARSLAAHVDQGLATALAQGPSDRGDSGTEEPGSSSEDVYLDIVGVFFGEGTIANKDLVQFMDCPKADPGNPHYDPRTALGFVGARCGGALEGLKITQRIVEKSREKFPEPTPLQQALIETWVETNAYAALVGKDGEPLFPSVVGAINVIDRMVSTGLTYTTPGGQTVPAAKRFLEMLMAIDASSWSKRFAEDSP